MCEGQAIGETLMSGLALLFASILVFGAATDALAASKKRVNWSAAYATGPSGASLAMSQEEEARFDHPKGYIQGY